MSISKQTVDKLKALYDERHELQRAKENCHHNFWVGAINDAFSGTGTRAAVVQACGGIGPFIDVLHNATVQRIEKRQQELDALIVELGGEP